METKQILCKRLKYRSFLNSESVSTLLGVVLSDDGQFIKFRTGRKEYLINKNYLVAIEDTTEPFVEVLK